MGGSLTINPSVTTIIVNWNGGKTILEVIASVLAQDPGVDLHLLVIDQASMDGSYEAILQKFSRIEVRRAAHNMGYAAGCNLGILYAPKTDFYLFLACDIVLPKHAVFEFIKAVKEYPAVGLLNPMVCFSSGEVDFAGTRNGILPGRMPHLRKRKKTTENAHESHEAKSFPVSRSYGGVLFVSKAVFERIGLWDERFFLYYEDVDLSFRARKAGFELRCVKTVTATHLTRYNPTNLPPHITYYHTRNWLYFLKRQGDLNGIGSLWFFLIFFWGLSVRLYHPLKWKAWKAFGLGIWDFLRGKTGKGFEPYRLID